MENSKVDVEYPTSYPDPSLIHNMHSMQRGKGMVHTAVHAPLLHKMFLWVAVFDHNVLHPIDVTM